MSETMRLMCVLAHPDDESMGTGSTLAKYASQGVEICLVMATRGEKGWTGEEKDYPGAATLGKLRQAELTAAAQVLGVQQVYYLDYIDGELDQVDSRQVIHKISKYIRLVCPQVVITFGPDGAYGHPDHIAISQFTTAAVVCAADASYAVDDQLPAHRISKLYYMMDTAELWREFESIAGEVTMEVDGTIRKPVMWEDWAPTARIDAGEHWRSALQAVLCHRSQVSGLGDLTRLLDEQQHRLWGVRTYYRTYSLVNSGRAVEDDLFAGL
jgi:LmbE family N-acetylglucosaminyl deacetylase